MSSAPSAEMPFIVLSDSTLQFLLWMDGSGKSYGVETVDQDPLRQAIICPGASLVMPRDGTVRTPPVLDWRGTSSACWAMNIRSPPITSR